VFVKFLCNWPPYKDGQCLEVLDRISSHFVSRCMAEVVTAADVQAYARTMTAVDRAIDKRIGEMPARGGRRVITEDEYAHEIGRDRSGYWQAAKAHFAKRLNVSGRLPAAITVRS
jgi:hypothetical protein